MMKQALDKKAGENHKLDTLTGEDFKSEIDKMLATVDQEEG